MCLTNCIILFNATTLSIPCVLCLIVCMRLCLHIYPQDCILNWIYRMKINYNYNYDY